MIDDSLGNFNRGWILKILNFFGVSIALGF